MIYLYNFYIRYKNITEYTQHVRHTSMSCIHIGYANVCLSVLLQTCLSLSTVAWKCRQASTLANANACKMLCSPQSVLLQMLMHANLQHVSLSVLLLGNAFGASAKCLILSAVANAQSAVFLVNMPNKPARPVISIFRSQWLIAAHCRTEIQIAVAHSSALPN